MLYLGSKIYDDNSIVIGHAGIIPPKKIRHGYVKQLFWKKVGLNGIWRRVYTIQEILFSIAQLLHGA